MRRLTIAIGTVFVLCSAPITAANAVQINAGGETGAYYSTFCPALKKELDKSGKSGECLVTDGTRENMSRVYKNPDQFGFAQLDVFSFEADKQKITDSFEIVRTYNANECLFAVTRDKSLTNYGELAVNANRLHFFLPPRTSGSAGTFEYLRKIDATGLAQARQIDHAVDTDEAIRLALAEENGVAFFVQFPDPSNERFKTIRKLNGHVVPIVDSELLRQTGGVGNDTIYFPQQTSISQLKFLNFGRVVTVCTPMVLFTGSANQMASGKFSQQQRADHRLLVLSTRALPEEALVPPLSPIAKMLKTTEKLPARLRYHFQEMSATARERARPFLDRLYLGANHWVRLMVLKARPPEYREVGNNRNN